MKRARALSRVCWLGLLILGASVHAQPSEQDRPLAPFECPPVEVIAILPVPSGHPAEQVPTWEYVEHSTVATSYSSLRSTMGEGTRYSYGGPSLRATLHRELPGCQSPGLFRARVSASRLTATSSLPADLVDRSSWAVGLGVTLGLPRWARPLQWSLNLDAEYGGGLGFASELVPTALDDVMDAAVSPALALSGDTGFIELDGYLRYRQLFGAGGRTRGLWDGGVMVDPLCFIPTARGLSRVGYQYTRAFTKGGFQSHELRLGYQFELWMLGNTRVGVDGVAELSRIDTSRSARAFQVRLAVERF